MTARNYVVETIRKTAPWRVASSHQTVSKRVEPPRIGRINKIRPDKVLAESAVGFSFDIIVCPKVNLCRKYIAKTDMTSRSEGCFGVIGTIDLSHHHPVVVVTGNIV